MSIIIDDNGIRRETSPDAIVQAQEIPTVPETGKLAVTLRCDENPEVLRHDLERIALLCIRFSRFADRRGFAAALRLRNMGYVGRLRAEGHVLADHYTLARRAGFDEVALSGALAHRQKPEHWRFFGNWRHDLFGSRNGS